MNLNATSAELHAILVESICRSIRLIEIQQQDPQFQDMKLSAKLPEVMHFKPRGCGHFFTIVYPGDSTNDNTSKIFFIIIIFGLIVSHNKFSHYQVLYIIHSI